MTQPIAGSPATTTSPAEVVRWLVDRIRFYGQVDADAVAPDTALTELGLDSIYVMTLCGDIEDTYGVGIDPTFFGDYDTLGEAGVALAARL